MADARKRRLPCISSPSDQPSELAGTTIADARKRRLLCISSPSDKRSKLAGTTTADARKRRLLCISSPSDQRSKLAGTTMEDAKKSLDYWRKFLGSAKSDIFELIDKAIVLAAVDRPDEFKERKDSIVEKICSGDFSLCAELQNSDNGDEDPRKEEEELEGEERNSSNCEHPNEIPIDIEVMRIKEVICSGSVSDSVLYDALSTLQLMQLSVETLRTTEIGKMVNSLRKHSSAHIRNLVRNLVHGWKLMVYQWLKSTAESSALISEQKVSSHCSSGAKRKHVEEVSDKMKLDITKKKLHEGYQRAENEKKRRMIKLINPKDLPVDEKRERGGRGRRRRQPAF